MEQAACVCLSSSTNTLKSALGIQVLDPQREIHRNKCYGPKRHRRDFTNAWLLNTVYTYKDSPKFTHYGDPKRLNMNVLLMWLQFNFK